MSIPQSLNDADLRFECPRCQHPIVRKGSWFKSVATFKCAGCQTALRLGYPAKLRLFEKHKQSTSPDRISQAR
ncbi:hypothetical protein DPM33_23760 [Mesorhizobium hawassense]|uniref:Uncharacterized protein n=1 Tax=Mesorhizobium hawassense TaxID=1209954 RepID=A0A330HPE3_9HYPH|nr:hypothetical protein DPM33_23760 [Mesorhizobium hawassense]